MKKKSTVTIVLGAIGIALGFCGVVDYFVPYMTWLGIVIPPMAAVMVADYLVLPLFGVKHNYNYNDISYENLPLIKWPFRSGLGMWCSSCYFLSGHSGYYGMVATVVLHVVLIWWQ